jgi:hypothetical protein
MSRFIKLAVLLLSVMAFSNVTYSQYTPSGGYETNDIIKRLSMENFRNIRLLMTAIINYGGGENEFSNLVNGYSEATSQYFAKEYDNSVATYTKNEKDISDTAMSLAKKYKERTAMIHKKMIDDNVRGNLKKSLAGKGANPSLEKIVGEASESYRKANELYSRKRPVQALALYRRAKEKCIYYYEVQSIKLPEEYDRDKQDAQNQIYKAKEKMN